MLTRNVFLDRRHPNLKAQRAIPICYITKSKTLCFEYIATIYAVETLYRLPLYVSFGKVLSSHPMVVGSKVGKVSGGCFFLSYLFLRRNSFKFANIALLLGYSCEMVR